MEDGLEGNTCSVDNSRDTHKEIYREEQERRVSWKRAGSGQIYRGKNGKIYTENIQNREGLREYPTDMGQLTGD